MIVAAIIDALEVNKREKQVTELVTDFEGYNKIKKPPALIQGLIQAMRKLFAVGGGFEPPRGS